MIAINLKAQFLKDNKQQPLTAPMCNAAIVETLKGITPTKTRQTDLDFEKRIIFTIEI